MRYHNTSSETAHTSKQGTTSNALTASPLCVKHTQAGTCFMWYPHTPLRNSPHKARPVLTYSASDLFINSQAIVLFHDAPGVEIFPRTAQKSFHKCKTAFPGGKQKTSFEPVLYSQYHPPKQANHTKQPPLVNITTSTCPPNGLFHKDRPLFSCLTL